MVDFTSRLLNSRFSSVPVLLLFLGTLASAMTTNDNVKIGLVYSQHGAESPVELTSRIQRGTTEILIDVQPLHLTTTNPFESIEYMQRTICANGFAGLIYAGNSGRLENIPEASFVAWTAENLKIPTVSVTSPVTFQNPKSIADISHLQASLEDTCKVMLKFLEHFGWRYATLIIGTDPISLEFAIAMKYVIQTEFNLTKVVVDSVDFHADIDSHVASLYNGDSAIFLVYTNFVNAKLLFQAAEKHKLLGEGFVWITAGAVMDDTDVLSEHFPGGFLGIKHRNPDYDVIRKIRDAASVYEAAILDYANKGNDVSQLQAPGCERNDVFQEIVNVSLVPYLTRQVLNRNGRLFSPKYTIVNIDMNSNMKQVGTWQNNEIHVEHITWLGNYQLTGHGNGHDALQQRLRIVTVEEMPFINALPLGDNVYESQCSTGVLCKKEGENGVFCCGGYAIDLLKELKRRVDFEYDLFVMKNYGRFIMESRQWNGVVGDLVYGKADMVVGGLKLSSERQRVIDYSVPFMASGVSVIVEQSRGKTPARAVWDPFNFLVWIMALVVFLGITSLIVFFFEWYSPTGYARKYTEPKGSNFTVEDSIWMTWALVFNNSLPHRVPKSLSGKFMATVWAFYSLVFIALYTANLTAHMIKVETKLPIKGFMDSKIQNPYSANSPIKYATVKNTNTESLIASFNTRMHSYMQPFMVTSAKEGIEDLDEGKLDVFIYDAMVAEYLSSRDHQCDLITVDSAFAMTGYAVAFTRGSPWRPKIDEALLEFIDNGFLNTLRAKWFNLDACLKRESATKRTDHLGPDNVSGAFFFLGGGLAASVFVILGEFFLYKYAKPCFVRVFKERALMSLISETIGKLFYPNQSLETVTCCETCYQEILVKRERLEETNARIKELEKLLGDGNDKVESSNGQSQAAPIWHACTREADKSRNPDEASTQAIKHAHAELVSMETTL